MMYCFYELQVFCLEGHMKIQLYKNKLNNILIYLFQSELTKPKEYYLSHSSFFVSIRIKIKSNRLNNGLATLILSVIDKFKLYLLFGFIAAITVQRVSSLHTKPAYEINRENNNIKNIIRDKGYKYFSDTN